MDAISRWFLVGIYESYLLHFYQNYFSLLGPDPRSQNWPKSRFFPFGPLFTIVFTAHDSPPVKTSVHPNCTSIGLKICPITFVVHAGVSQWQLLKIWKNRNFHKFFFLHFSTCNGHVFTLYTLGNWRRILLDSCGRMVANYRNRIGEISSCR